MDSIKKDSILLSSTEVIEELKDVLMRAKFDKYLSRQKRIEFIKSFFNDTEFFAPLSKITDCSDPKDNKFLELAIDGKATDIISGDSDLLEMNPYRGIKILMAADFLKELP
jgi:putative PIN family toxin of toxin-antitoxin system